MPIVVSIPKFKDKSLELINEKMFWLSSNKEWLIISMTES